MYDENDLKKILSRAIELQNRVKGSALTPGIYQKLTLEEIEEIARESGLSPEYVRQAAIEMEGIPIEESFFVDTGNSHDVELIGLAGARPDTKTWAELRAHIEEHFKTEGVVERRREGIFWKGKAKGLSNFLRFRKSPSVEFTSSGNKSLIRIQTNMKRHNILLFPAYAFLAGAVSLITFGLNTGAIEALLFAIALAGFSKFFFAWCKTLKSRSKERLKDMMGQLQTIIMRHHSASRASSGKGTMTTPESRETEAQTGTPESKTRLSY